MATTDATVTGNQMTGAIHDGLAARSLLPGRHCLDSGYLSAALAAAEAARHGVALTGPLLAGTSAQARAAGGYARAGFTLCYGTKTVTCPQGKTSSSWMSCTQRGQAAPVAAFSSAGCGPCPVRHLCTASSKKRRQLTILPRDLAEAQAAGHGARRARYRGLPRTRPDHAFTATALNLLRLEAYWNGTPPDRQRTSHLARLELSLAA